MRQISEDLYRNRTRLEGNRKKLQRFHDNKQSGGFEGQKLRSYLKKLATERV
jgi:hypothetical protein